MNTAELWGAEYGPADRFDAEIEAFESSDLENPPPAHAIVCTGSSSIAKWHPTLAEDLAPLTVLGRGFGGSNMNELVHYAPRCVLPYEPRAILVYEGDNDLAQGAGPARISAMFDRFVKLVRETLPHVHIYCVSTKPSPSRWEMWEAIQETNRRLRERCEAARDMCYIDVAGPMLNDLGKVRGELFADDQLHLNRRGYELWREVIRPVLLAGELSYEAPVTR